MKDGLEFILGPPPEKIFSRKVVLETIGSAKAVINHLSSLPQKQHFEPLQRAAAKQKAL
jgi:hypothetical protein